MSNTLIEQPPKWTIDDISHGLIKVFMAERDGSRKFSRPETIMEVLSTNGDFPVVNVISTADGPTTGPCMFLVGSAPPDQISILDDLDALEERCIVGGFKLVLRLNGIYHVLPGLVQSVVCAKTHKELKTHRRA